MVINVPGHPVNVSGVDHYGARPRFDGCIKRRKKIFAQIVFRNPRGGSISSGQREAVAHVVFQTGSDTILRSDIGPFEASNKRRTQHFSKIWIFAERFPETWPKWIASQIEYGRKAPGNTNSARFHRGDFRTPLHQLGIPGGSHANFLWEESGALDVGGAVNRIDAVDNRNAQPGLFRCGLLNLTDDLMPLVRRECLIRDVEN